MGELHEVLKIWVKFVVVYAILYAVTFLIDLPYFNEILNASLEGLPLNASPAYEGLLVATSPFNPIEDFAYPSPLTGFLYNFVLGVVLFSLFSFVGTFAMASRGKKIKSVIIFSILAPLLSSYIYVSSVYLLTDRIVTGTSGFGVSTLLAPVVSAPLRGLSKFRLIVIVLNALIVTFSLLMIYSSSGAVPIVFIATLYVTFFVTFMLLGIDAWMKQKSIVRKLAALGLDVIALLLAWNSYLRPSPEGAFVNHLVILSVFFVLSSIMASLINRTG
ncbi:MAG: hypothetical protein RQ879_02220 [Sulfolobales archaeon]|nr:hypothetical protein [Sulfolobales archaeon]